jgi:hypothetical protein
VNGENNTPFKLQASLENVQEFRIESNNYPAEYGTGTGGQISVVTKSGGNRFTGSVFEYGRSDKLDARNYFDSQRNPDGSVSPGAAEVDVEAEPVWRFDWWPIQKTRRSSSAAMKGIADAGRTSSRPCRAAARGHARCPPLPRCSPASSARAATLLRLQHRFRHRAATVDADVREDAFSVRVDLRLNTNWTNYAAPLPGRR